VAVQKCLLFVYRASCLH